MEAQRIFDVIVAAALLVLCAMPMAAVACVILLTSGAPVIFRHERVGRNGVPFDVLKFRTMRASNCGPQVTVGGDARVTAVGRILRRTKLDELPQLINVLRGEMSIVGPRPEVAAYVGLFPDRFSEILKVRPGITDPASLVFRDEEAVLAEADDPDQAYKEVVLPQKLALAAEYVAHRTVWTDLRIVARTIKAILK